MQHSFTIEPYTYIAFQSEAELIDHCKQWGLLSDKASKSKAFYYKRGSQNLPCEIVGFVDKVTAVIKLDNGQTHCIHPSYLKEMQAANFSQKLTSAAEQATGSEPAKDETLLAAQTEVPQETILESEPASNEESLLEAPEITAAPKTKAKKEKAPKLQLPEDKVKMTAIVQEFTTVPNHFSDNDDEVVIYEAVAITEPEEVQIGTAWSSHSATLKKLELEVGDKIIFEGKIVAKKLTKHPVPYKINNPGKIVKNPAES
ncbi:hypothetical protein E0485_06010 [Paenibacillus albiflavus]|uniref:Uncharacterized protein n=1 Tax=Paenibacillus albiflavus TaxID=2545760 RepID=A0A4R4EH30_9BACL|nr:hypothetical protein [Paenibacillus albiflavus]TCZ79414.1 hypothetical protein E0485_06010 [Paenibacillus albiflavus]